METLPKSDQASFERIAEAKWAEEAAEVAALSLQRGSFQLSSGTETDYKFDLEPLLEDAALGRQLGAFMQNKINASGIIYDTAGGLEKGGRLTAAAVSANGRSFSISKELAIYDRLIGDIKPRDNVLVIDDVTTSGASIIGPINYLLAYGYNVVGAAALIDRSWGQTEQMVNALGLPYAWGFTAAQLLTVEQRLMLKSRRSRGRSPS